MTYIVKISGTSRDKVYDELLPKVLKGFRLDMKGHLTVKSGDTLFKLPKFHKLVNDYMQENDTILFYNITDTVKTLGVVSPTIYKSKDATTGLVTLNIWDNL